MTLISHKSNNSKYGRITTWFASDGKIIISCAAISFLALFLRLYKVQLAPSYQLDETTHFILGLNTLKGHFMRAPDYLGGGPWFTHPPLHFMLEALYLLISGITTETLNSVLQARVVASTFGGILSIIIFLLCLKLCNLRSAIIASALYAVDPFILLWSRLNTLEPVALCFAVAFLYFLYNGKQTLAVIMLGLCLVAKETSIFAVVVIIIFPILKRLLKADVKPLKSRKVVIIAFLIYSAYVVWGLNTNSVYFIIMKICSVMRIMGIIRDTGYTAENFVPFLADVALTLDQYLITWANILLSIFSLIYLARQKQSRESIFMLSWYLATAIFFSLIQLRNPQYFIYPLIPAFSLNAYIFSIAIDKLGSLKIRQSFSLPKLDMKSLASLLMVSFLVFSYIYNLHAWYDNYYTRSTNAAQEVIDYVEKNIPKGSAIHTSGGLENYLHNYTLFTVTTYAKEYSSIDGIRGKDIHYFIISPRWYWVYEPELVDYILTNGSLLAHFEARELQGINIYYVENPV